MGSQAGEMVKARGGGGGGGGPLGVGAHLERGSSAGAVVIGHDVCFE